MPTILALFDDLRPAHLAELLPAGWRFVTKAEALAKGEVDVMVLDGRHNSDRDLYDVRAGLKSRIDCPQLTNKVELHELVAGEDITPCAWTITRWNNGGARIVDHRPHMWRPEGGWKGQGIAVVTDQDELDARRRDLDDDDRAVLTEYITHPLLLEGRKLNVRLYLIVATHRRGAAVLKRGLIGVGRSPYQRARWTDMRVHDSRTLIHADYRFPEDYPGDAAAFYARALALFDEVVRRARPHAKAYPESKHGFEVLGCDLMVDAQTDQVYLIEVNHKPGHEQLNPRNQDALSRVVCEGIVQFALALPTRAPPGYDRVGVVDSAEK